MKREEWMLGPGDGSLKGVFNEGGNKKTKSVNKIGSNRRELNPYFKDGGSGLPPGADAFTRSSTSLFQKPSDHSTEEVKAKDKEKGEVKETTVDSKDGDSLLADLLKMQREEKTKSNSDHNHFDRKLAEKISKMSNFGEMQQLSDRFKPSSSASRTEEYKRREMRECGFCNIMDTADEQQDRIISVGEYTMLLLPDRNAIDPLHCVIIPSEHYPSMREADENVWDEVRNYKKCLLTMAASLQRQVIFLECVTNPSRYSPFHARIDAVFLPSSSRVDPKGYYRKALMEGDAEYSQNKSIIDTGEKGGLRKSIPRNFPYCYADFRLDQGMVHVIEDVNKMNWDFLLSITAQLLGKEGRHEWKGPSRYSTESINKFKKLFAPFDWAQSLQ